jgi:hypothetical protein
MPPALEEEVKLRQAIEEDEKKRQGIDDDDGYRHILKWCAGAAAKPSPGRLKV